MRIYAILQQDKKVVVNDLAEKFGVTKMTIRRDLSFFEKQGIVKTSYGGAYLTSGASVEPSFQLKSVQMVDDKHLIGQKAAERWKMATRSLSTAAPRRWRLLNVF
jgi:DeoR/GlpR family transcriptional regulator of sugar metabolism